MARRTRREKRDLYLNGDLAGNYYKKLPHIIYLWTCLNEKTNKASLPVLVLNNLGSWFSNLKFWFEASRCLMSRKMIWNIVMPYVWEAMLTPSFDFFFLYWHQAMPYVRNTYEFQGLKLTAKAYQCRVKAINARMWKVLLARYIKPRIQGNKATRNIVWDASWSEMWEGQNQGILIHTHQEIIRCLPLPNEMHQIQTQSD